MTRNEAPQGYFEHLCLMVEAIFAAEKNCINRDNISAKFHDGEITKKEYIEAVADELLSRTDKDELV